MTKTVDFAFEFFASFQSDDGYFSKNRNRIVQWNGKNVLSSGWKVSFRPIVGLLSDSARAILMSW